MGGVFDLLLAIETTLVAGNNLIAICDANLFWRCENGKGSAYTIVWNAVVVAVEANIGLFVHFDRHPFVGGVVVIGQRQ